MSYNAHLSQEEQAFIRELCEQPPALSMNETAPEHINEALEQLAQHAHLNIEAHTEQCRLSFPLYVRHREGFSPQVELGIPSITELGTVERAWRLALPKPLSVRYSRLQKSPWRAHEISVDSILLSTEHGPLPQDLNGFYLYLADGRRIALNGQRVRRPSTRRCVYRLALSREEQATLQGFMYSQYRLVHPELPLAG